MWAIEYPAILLITIGIGALLYSSVGHGGASGYIAAMALFGMEHDFMRPTALVMNIFVTLVVLYQCYPQSRINWRLFAPLVLVSLPMAFIGGTVTTNSDFYKIIVGVLLLLASVRMLAKFSDNTSLVHPKTLQIMIVGGVLGFVSGLTGVGGGIYLSPLLLLFNWSKIVDSVPIAAAFILLNSMAGLVGYTFTGKAIPQGIAPLVVIAVVGGLIGSMLSKHKNAPIYLRKMLAVILVIAGSKMLLSF